MLQPSQVRRLHWRSDKEFCRIYEEGVWGGMMKLANADDPGGTTKSGTENFARSRLLEPHLRTQLELDASVLYGSMSPFASGCPTLVDGRAPLHWDTNLNFNRWLSSYYAIVLGFVRDVVSSSDVNCVLEVIQIFNAVNKVSPFFPSGNEVKSDKELLVYSVANFIFGVSFWHSGDQASLREHAGNTDVVRRPRCPGPHECTLSKDEFASTIQSWGDWYKQFMWSGTFLDFIPHPLRDATLMGVTYDFPEELQTHVRRLKSALKTKEQALLEERINVMTLEKVVTVVKEF
ncbi:hypothetical protein M427DRAFT_43381 [Gonapodya prolifera JEL478]|uniref:Uncharacterized protein n=1 Tax=Gonapodya prolifera (strain JEL478) TaxID=1344416 RepID=A0A139AJD8_GONPJ|nr:hypothetical protein M427DRAFT_43381 [Gonapodya prolifera JEL478]|eukprot:KXS16859.1 hypothetical protein M427DRAFT_43381 [Gonapodya prolifera JEL478]